MVSPCEQITQYACDNVNKLTQEVYSLSHGEQSHTVTMLQTHYMVNIAYFTVNKAT